MSTKPFVYQDPFPLAHDDTEYYLLSKEHVSVAEFDGQQVLKVEPQALTLLAQQAFHVWGGDQFCIEVYRRKIRKNSL